MWHGFEFSVWFQFLRLMIDAISELDKVYLPALAGSFCLGFVVLHFPLFIFFFSPTSHIAPSVVFFFSSSHNALSSNFLVVFHLFGLPSVSLLSLPNDLSEQETLVHYLEFYKHTLSLLPRGLLAPRPWFSRDIVVCVTCGSEWSYR